MWAATSAAAPVRCPALARADAYERRRPEETLLYRLVEEHWPAFLEKANESSGLPGFVVRDFEEYLRCGILEHGCVKLACRRCGHEKLVAFSCKRRGFYPSCLGRRMSDIAARLVDEVLPEVPIRQWVCSLPWSLRPNCEGRMRVVEIATSPDDIARILAKSARDPPEPRPPRPPRPGQLSLTFG